MADCNETLGPRAARVQLARDAVDPSLWLIAAAADAVGPLFRDLFPTLPADADRRLATLHHFAPDAADGDEVPVKAVTVPRDWATIDALSASATRCGLVGVAFSFRYPSLLAVGPPEFACAIIFTIEALVDNDLARIATESN